MNIKFLKILGLVLFLFIFSSNTQAQEIEESNTVQIASVNVSDTRIISQNGNEVKIGFTLYNFEGAQANVKYGIQLLEVDSRQIVDEKTFSEVVNLPEAVFVEKEITYLAPKYLSGKFEVMLVARNTSGIPLGLGPAGDIILSGNGEYIEIVNELCSISISGDNETYATHEAVNVRKDEAMILKCRVENHFNKDTQFSSRYSIYPTSLYGIALPAKPLSNIKTIPKNGGKDITTQILIPQKSGFYESSFFLENAGKIISNKISFTFIVMGQKAQIENIIFDKDYYFKGSDAKVSLVWTGQRGFQQGVRDNDLSEFSPLTANLNIKNNRGKICGETSQIDLPSFTLRAELEIPIIRDCEDPTVSVSILNAEGNILDEKQYGVKSTSSSEGSTLLNLLIFGGILILGLIIYVFKKISNHDDILDNTKSI